MNHRYTLDLSISCQYWIVGLPRWLSGKQSVCQCRRCRFDPWVGKSPGGGNDNLLQYSCLEKSHGQRNLAGCSPWGGKRIGHDGAAQARACMGSSETMCHSKATSGLIWYGYSFNCIFHPNPHININVQVHYTQLTNEKKRVN